MNMELYFVGTDERDALEGGIVPYRSAVNSLTLFRGLTIYRVLLTTDNLEPIKFFFDKEEK